MLFIPNDAFEKTRMTGERAVEMAFKSSGLQWRSLEGVLLLHPALSARAGGEPRDTDPDIERMYWPIPIDKKVHHAPKDLWTVLPGAPLAWVKRLPTSYSSPAAVMNWCKVEAAFPKEVHDELRKYLDETPAVHSFVSIPFPEQDGYPPIAVLNVHSSKPGLLESRDKSLLVLVRPVLEILTFMLRQLSDLRTAAGKPAHLT
jgi:hypothetical protein